MNPGTEPARLRSPSRRGACREEAGAVGRPGALPVLRIALGWAAPVGSIVGPGAEGPWLGRGTPGGGVEGTVERGEAGSADTAALER